MATNSISIAPTPPPTLCVDRLAMVLSDSCVQLTPPTIAPMFLPPSSDPDPLPPIVVADVVDDPSVAMSGMKTLSYDRGLRTIRERYGHNRFSRPWSRRART